MARRRHHLLLAGLFAASLGLRPQIVAVGPLLPSITHGLGVSHSVAGLLPTIVVLCMGLFAPLSVRIGRRVGSRNAIAAALALIGVCGVARALVPSAAVIVFTIPLGIGVAIAGSLMPGAVGEAWPERPAFATGVYTTGISLGAALSAAAAVPLAGLAWGWRGSLAIVSAATLAILAAWLPLTAREPPHARPERPPPRIPWRSGVGWRLVAIFALTSVLYYGINAWLPSVYVDRGWSRASAGDLVTVISVVTLPASLLVAWGGDRFGSRRHYLLSAAVLLLLSGLALIVLPGGAWLWAVLIGISLGVVFPSLMTLPLDVASDQRELQSLAAMMLGLGYTLSSLAPFLFGFVRDATGSFTAVLWLLVASAVLLVLAALFVPPATRTAAAASRPGSA